MKLARLFALILLPFSAAAQTTTVTANLRDVGVVNLTPGTPASITFELQNFQNAIPRVISTNAVIGQVAKAYVPDTSGQVSGTVYDNTYITPAGTFYKVCVAAQGYTTVCDTYTITGPSWNLSNATPNTTSPVIPAPTGDGTYLRLDAGNGPLTGALASTSTISDAGGTHTGTETFSGPLVNTGTDSGNQTISGNKALTGQNTIPSPGNLTVTNASGITVTGSGSIAVNGGGVITIANQSDLILIAGGGIRATPAGSSNLLIDGAPPSLQSGFGTSPSIAVNTSLAFTITIGSGGTASTGVILFGNVATHGWNVFCEDLTTFSTTVFRTRQTASTTNTATIGNFNSSAVAAPWGAGDVLSCMAAAR